MINKNLNKNYSYPDPNDSDFQKKIFQKREFYYHKVPHREIMKSYDEIQKYREDNCAIFELREHQKIISNFINPNTPYKGLLLMHGTGTGKTGGAISIAEQFKEQVKKYNTKKYVLVPGPNTRENWKSELILTTGKTYLKNRGLKFEDVQLFNLGFVTNEIDFYELLLKNFNKKDIDNSGIFYFDEKKKKFINRFRERIIFPIKNISGDIIAMGARAIKDNNYLAKYINSPETQFFKKGSNLYNLDKSRKLSNKID